MDSEALGFLPRRWELNRADGEALTSHQGTDRGNSRRTALPSVTGSSVRAAEDGRTPTESGVTGPCSLCRSESSGSGQQGRSGQAPRASSTWLSVRTGFSSYPQGSK